MLHEQSRFRTQLNTGFALDTFLFVYPGFFFILMKLQRTNTASIHTAPTSYTATFIYPDCHFYLLFNPDFAVAIYCGLKSIAATLVDCFETPVLLTGSQRETIGTCVPLLFHPSDGTKLPVARVVVYDTIFLLTISTDMPASHNRSNYAFC
jgi:hypothetical protein